MALEYGECCCRLFYVTLHCGVEMRCVLVQSVQIFVCVCVYIYIYIFFVRNNIMLLVSMSMIIISRLFKSTASANHLQLHALLQGMQF